MARLLTTDFVVGVFLGLALVTCVCFNQTELAGQIAAGLTGFLGRVSFERYHGDDIKK
ncbi:MAG: hypothetical protein IJ709_13235 [Selenomonas sp.]|nr:hypothetical protein [Selenomonas sp.]